MSWLDSFVRDKRGRVVIWQSPNLPLIGWLLCRLVALLVEGNTKTIIGYIGTAFLLVWALLEITKGASLFRRALGWIVLLSIILSIIFS